MKDFTLPNSSTCHLLNYRGHMTEDGSVQKGRDYHHDHSEDLKVDLSFKNPEKLVHLLVVCC